MMKIAIMTDTMDRVGMGTAVYTRMLVENLLPLLKDADAELYLVHSKKTDDPLYAKVHEVMLPQVNIPKLRKILSEALFLWKTRNDFDIIHYPQESNYPLFFLTNAKVVVSMHSHINGWRDYGMKSRYRQVRAMLGFFSRYVSAIITPSTSTKKGIIDQFHIPEAKVAMIPLAADEVYFSAPSRSDAQALVAKELSLSIPYAYAPGRSDLQKNVPRIVEAFGKAKKSAQFPHILAIGSRHRPDEDAKIDHIIERDGLSDCVVYLPRVRNEIMPALFAGADITVFPSLHEGFGLPIVESMAAGTPVITSTAYSMPEVLGDAGILVNPESVDEIAEAISKLLQNPELRDGLSQKGRVQARTYSWPRMAKEVLIWYKNIVKK